MDWRPLHHGEGRYRRQLLAKAFNVAMVGFAISAGAFLVWAIFR